jgi:peptide/histidine transporter 3/4
MATQTIGSLLYLYPANCSLFTNYIGQYVMLPLSLVLFGAAITIFMPNVLAFMMDQLVEVSNKRLSSIIRWFVWSVFVGLFLSYLVILPSTYKPTSITDNLPVISLFMAVFYSIPLIIHFYTAHLYRDNYPKSQSSPYRIIYGVLKYSWEHKAPTNRSALTYWEEGAPKRIDLAKEKYGGPYTYENVEDVKTFWRLIFFILTLGVYYIAYTSFSNQTIMFAQHLDQKANSLQYDQWIIYLIDPLVTVLCIPILELVILPLYPKFEYILMKSVIWIGLGTVCAVISSFSYFMIDIVAHTTSNTTGICFLNLTNNKPIESIPSTVVIIPAFFWGLSDLLVAPSIFTFLCCQAPYNMRGMILGSFMLIQQVIYFLSSEFGIIFSLFNFPFPLSCGVWFWGIQIFLSVFGVISFLIGAKIYKKRQRQDVEQHRRIIEDVFMRRLEARKKEEDRLSQLIEDSEIDVHVHVDIN